MYKAVTLYQTSEKGSAPMNEVDARAKNRKNVNNLL